jgi:hypothetical protein
MMREWQKFDGEITWGEWNGGIICKRCGRELIVDAQNESEICGCGMVYRASAKIEMAENDHVCEFADYDGAYVSIFPQEKCRICGKLRLK